MIPTEYSALCLGYSETSLKGGSKPVPPVAFMTPSLTAIFAKTKQKTTQNSNQGTYTRNARNINCYLVERLEELSQIPILGQTLQ